MMYNGDYGYMGMHYNLYVDQLLKDDSRRSKIISSFIDQQAYRMDMMNAMLENDCCRA